MIVVIVCSADKSSDAGKLRDEDGSQVMFVANPDYASDRRYVHVRPDDETDSIASWREKLLEYNDHYRSSGDNPLGLLPAGELYEPRAPYSDTYRRLVAKYGVEYVYILSAGWGLISADFLTPDYNITFASSGPKQARRSKRDLSYYDFCQLPPDPRGPIVFLGGNAYESFFRKLTYFSNCRKVIWYYNDVEQGTTKTLPHKPGYEFKSFDTTKQHKYTWHYECANQFIDGTISLDR